jgi:transposase InsO family protein
MQKRRVSRLAPGHRDTSLGGSYGTPNAGSAGKSRRMQAECRKGFGLRHINMFWSLAQTRVMISDWTAEYDHRRRHSALGYQAPAVCAAARTQP